MILMLFYPLMMIIRLREKIYKLSIDEPPTDDKMVEKNFTDNVRRIKEKWYKEQKRQVQLKLRQADESGDRELIHKLTCQKQNLMREEKELQLTNNKIWEMPNGERSTIR